MISQKLFFITYLTVTVSMIFIENTTQTDPVPAKDLIVIGHRGMGSEMKENTIEAFKTAHSIKLDYIETDVWLTRDLVPVITHGDSTHGYCQMEDKVTKEKKNIYITKTDYADLKKLVYTKTGEPMPTLRKVLKIFKEGKTKVNLELKDWRPEIVKVAQEVIFELDMADKIFFSSFVHKHHITLHKELKNLGYPTNTFGFGYLSEYWYLVPDWNALQEYINPGIDYLILDTEMMLYGWKDEFLQARDEASKYGVGLGLYIDMKLLSMEQDSFYDDIVKLDVKLFITNVPNIALDYKSRKFLVGEENTNCPFSDWDLSCP